MAEFSARVARLRELCASLQTDGRVDRVVWLDPDPNTLCRINQRYAGVTTRCSHDHLGHASAAYFLGWDSVRTRYVAHFDADILLWQQPGFSWIRAGVDALRADESLVAASPRIAPPTGGPAMVDVAAPGSGWLPSWPLVPVAAGWRSPWFSTRCHLLDRERLARFLPLGGTAGHRRAAAFERIFSPLFTWEWLTGPRRSALARRLASLLPPFPLPPEVLLHEKAQREGFACLYLGAPQTWYIHPDTKPDAFTRLLPHLIGAVVNRGEVPDSQRGVSGLHYAAWESFAARLK
jgi:hypothetical protein